LCLVVLAACGDRGGSDDVAANLLTAAPRLDAAVDAAIGGVTYLGNLGAAPRVAPGGVVELTHVWRVVTPPGPGWSVYAYVVSERGDWMDISRTPMRTAHPPSAWRAGELFRDPDRFTLPAGWQGDHATIVLGLRRRGTSGGEGRAPVERGPVDDKGRVIAARFDVVRAGPGVGYRIARAKAPLTIDGVADEADWRAAPRSPPFAPTEGGDAIAGASAARLLWDDRHLYAFVEVEDADVFSPYAERDAPLWKEDVVELFVDADGDRTGYVELQVNPNGAIFDAFFPRTRSQPSDVAWDSGLIAAIAVHGTRDRRDDVDRGWDVEIAIPLAAVKGTNVAMPVRIPPQPGDRWRLNLVRIDRPRDRGRIAASSWNPITIQDFHAPARMLAVEFAD
jgi:hypothetical protein